MKSKVIFDYFLALILSAVLTVPSIFIWILCSIDTKKNGLFLQERVGFKGKLFNIYKFRTIKNNPESSITDSTMKISWFGFFLRKYGIDEIPQLINILNGTMSFVGPRPDVSGYADKLTGEDKIILNIKPGITGPAQLKYRNEDEILKKVKNPVLYNDTILWKDKVKINRHYVENLSLKKDIYYLYKTIF
ncbi:MAG: sugar transferase [Flavobacteriales bacterium]|nr:sugar transferase [Flavobacteriales bacterium]